MTNQEEESLKEAKRKEMRIKEDAERLAKEQVRKKAYLTREQAIEKTWKVNKTKKLSNQLKTRRERKPCLLRSRR